MEVKIRPATPEDAAFLAEVLVIAARSHLTRGLWDFVVPDSDEERLEFLKTTTLTQKTHMLHYSNFIVSEVDGRPAAALSGHDSSELAMDGFMSAMGEVIPKMGWTPEFVEQAMKRADVCLLVHFDEPQGAWIVEGVATLPDFRRMGLINTLLDRIVDMGRQKGFKRAQVGVLIGNDPAIRAYQKAGFEIRGQMTNPEFEALVGEPGAYRMMQEL